MKQNFDPIALCLGSGGNGTSSRTLLQVPLYEPAPEKPAAPEQDLKAAWLRILSFSLSPRLC